MLPSSEVSPGLARWRPGEAAAPLSALLDRGGIVAFPTESSYGLGVDPASAAGVEAIYRLKRRERGRPLPVVAADLSQLAALGIDPGLPILKTLKDLWPGPLSVVLPTALDLPAAAGGGSLAVRIPGHPGLLRLLRELGRPLTSTSANESGEPPLLEPEAVAQMLAGTDAVLYDGGTCPGGLPSTLVEPVDPGNPAQDLAVKVLRAGRLPVQEIAQRIAVAGGSWN